MMWLFMFWLQTGLTCWFVSKSDYVWATFGAMMALWYLIEHAVYLIKERTSSWKQK